MKVAITGKGGVGKTTFASTLARMYADEGRTVLAADVDPDANLGLALGFSERQAFRKFVLPPAILTFFPTYQAEIVNLLKATAIVGYIAVQDLTKVADLIRARTFDAFMPLIVISVLYLILTWLFLRGTDWFLTKLNPKNRRQEEILRGVKP